MKCPQHFSAILLVFMDPDVHYRFHKGSGLYLHPDESIKVGDAVWSDRSQRPFGGMLVHFKPTTRCHIPADNNVYCHLCEDFKANISIQLKASHPIFSRFNIIISFASSYSSWTLNFRFYPYDAEQVSFSSLPYPDPVSLIL